MPYLSPVLPPLAVVGVGLRPLAQLLPPTGMPAPQAMILVSYGLIAVGAVTALRALTSGWAPWVLRTLVVAAIGAFAVHGLLRGAVGNGWGLVPLAVGVFTLSYASLAVGQLLPPQRVRSGARRAAGRHATADRRRTACS